MSLHTSQSHVRLLHLLQWRDTLGHAFAQLEIRAHDVIAVRYGWRGGPSWAVGVPHTRHGEDLCEWLRGIGWLAKPEVICRSKRGGTPLDHLPVIERVNPWRGPPGLAAMMRRATPPSR